MRVCFRRGLSMLLIALCAAACTDEERLVGQPAPPGPPPAAHISMIALGDSYTIGEGVPPGASWPEQLADSILADSLRVDSLTVVARTGWTTIDLYESARKLAGSRRTADVVFLQIGVNNQFAGFPIEAMEPEMERLVDLALTLARHDVTRVFVLSIPDYGVTPVGSRWGAERIRVEIDAHNAIVRAVAESRAVSYVDVTELSRLALYDTGLIARDELHFSARMYAMWVHTLRPLVAAAFRDPEGDK